MDKKQFVFLKSQEINGTSEKSGKPYSLRKISFADPTTFENHQLDYKDGLNLTYITKGEMVNLKLDLEQGFGGRDSRAIVTDVIPVK